MSNIVYLMCSLPSLSLGQNAPISDEEFHSDAKKQLSAKHFEKVEAIDIQKINGEASKGQLKTMAALMDDLKHDLSAIRKAKTERGNPELSRLPKNIFGLNPLDREKEIMQWVWDELDSIEAGKTFTLTEVMVYKLKLQILIRLNSFDTKQGLQVLNSVVNPSKTN